MSPSFEKQGQIENNNPYQYENFIGGTYSCKIIDNTKVSTIEQINKNTPPTDHIQKPKKDQPIKLDENYPMIKQFEESGSKQRISDSQKRIFGILGPDRILTQQSSAHLAVATHIGQNGKKFSIKRFQDGMRHNLTGGRGAEVLLCEQLISQTPKSQGFHFLPTKELDTEYKTDLCSILPIHEWGEQGTRVSSLNIGAQITVMKIDDNIKKENKKNKSLKQQKPNKSFKEKKESVRLMNEYIMNNKIRKEISTEYGRLNTPDILCFLAINGQISERFHYKSEQLINRVQKWKEENFYHEQDNEKGNKKNIADETMILSYFKPKFQIVVKNVADMVVFSQKYILTTNNLKKILNTKEGFTSTQNTIFIEYNFKKQELSFSIPNDRNDSTLAKITYFINPTQLGKIYTQLCSDEIIKSQKNAN